ncbi:hypothetical protein ACQJBY_056454 [Aegilops geniculata]
MVLNITTMKLPLLRQEDSLTTYPPKLMQQHLELIPRMNPSPVASLAPTMTWMRPSTRISWRMYPSWILTAPTRESPGSN